MIWNPFRTQENQRSDSSLFSETPKESLKTEHKKRIIQGYLGKTGVGKSFKMKKDIPLFLTQNKEIERVFIFDLLNEYGPNDTDFDTSGYVITADLEDFVKVATGDSKKVIHWPLEDEVEIQIFCDTVYSVGRCLVVIEEIDKVAPQRGTTPREILELFKRGRHRAVSIFWTTQRPAEVNKTILALTDKIYAFTVTETNDLKYLRQSFGEGVKDLPNLGQYKFKELP